MKTALIALMFLAGCASMMETRGDSPYAPSNERKGGRVKYRSTGAGFLVQSARDDAYRQMHERCGGDYRIVAETDEHGGTITTGHAGAYGNQAYGSSVAVNVGFRSIEFECAVAEQAKAPDAALLARIGAEIECSAENVSVERAYALRPGITGYDVAAFGDRYACTEDYGGMACRRVAPAYSDAEAKSAEYE